MHRWTWVGLTCALLGCTTGIEDAPADEACKQAAYAVASRRLGCGAEPRVANASYERFRATYVCASSAVQVEDFACSDGILATPCDQINARSDDDARYLQDTPACARILRRADGAPVALLDTPSRNPVCEAVLSPVLKRASECAEARSQAAPYDPRGIPDTQFVDGTALRQNLQKVANEVDAALRCRATDVATSSQACVEVLRDFGSCSALALNAPVNAVALLLASPPCRELFTEVGGTP